MKVRGEEWFPDLFGLLLVNHTVSKLIDALRQSFCSCPAIQFKAYITIGKIYFYMRIVESQIIFGYD